MFFPPVGLPIAARAGAVANVPLDAEQTKAKITRTADELAFDAVEVFRRFGTTAIAQSESTPGFHSIVGAVSNLNPGGPAASFFVGAQGGKGAHQFKVEGKVVSLSDLLAMAGSPEVVARWFSTVSGIVGGETERAANGCTRRDIFRANQTNPAPSGWSWDGFFKLVGIR